MTDSANVTLNDNYRPPQPYHPSIQGPGIHNKNQILEYLDFHNLLNDKQHGFHQGRTCRLT